MSLALCSVSKLMLLTRQASRGYHHQHMPEEHHLHLHMHISCGIQKMTSTLHFKGNFKELFTPTFWHLDLLDMFMRKVVNKPFFWDASVKLISWFRSQTWGQLHKLLARFHWFLFASTTKMSVSLSVEEVQTFLLLIAEERIQRELDGATRNEKVLCIYILHFVYFWSMFSVYICTFVSVFCFN